MGKNSSKSKHEPYSKFEDTPWISQGRQIADIGGKGILENYNKVNVFNEPTQKSLEARNNEIYKRAFDNMEREYTNTMNKYAANNYNRFGTLNATAPSYITDQYRLDAQRRMDDLAYNQAVNYDALLDAELKRRYNTLDMFGNLYQYGQIPHQVDIANWNTENTNKDIAYQNSIASTMNRSGGLQGGLQGGMGMGMATGNPYGAAAGGIAGALGGMM